MREFALEGIPGSEVSWIPFAEFCMNLIQTMTALVELIPPQYVVPFLAVLGLILVICMPSVITAVYSWCKAHWVLFRDRQTALRYRQAAIEQLENQDVRKPEIDGNQDTLQSNFYNQILEMSIFNQPYRYTRKDIRPYINKLATLYRNIDWSKENEASNMLMRKLFSEEYIQGYIFLDKQGVELPPTGDLDDPEYKSYMSLLNEWHAKTQGELVNYEEWHAKWHADFLLSVDQHNNVDWDSTGWRARKVRELSDWNIDLDPMFQRKEPEVKTDQSKKSTED